MERVLVAIGLWILLQFTASAYARGAGAPRPPSRYIDTLTIGLLLNTLLFWRMIPRIVWSRSRQRLVPIVSGISLALAAFGVGIYVVFAFSHDLPEERDLRAAQAANTLQYLRDGDPTDLRRGPIPYPDADKLMERLSHPELRAVLPAILQPNPGQAAPLSHAAAMATHAAPAIGALGLLLIIGTEILRYAKLRHLRAGLARS